MRLLLYEYFFVFACIEPPKQFDWLQGPFWRMQPASQEPVERKNRPSPLIPTSGRGVLSIPLPSMEI
jgi:hypothetical protein